MKTVTLNNSGGSIDFYTTVMSVISSFAEQARVHATLGGVISLGTLGTIDFLAGDGGSLGAGTPSLPFFSVSAVRISG